MLREEILKIRREFKKTSDYSVCCKKICERIEETREFKSAKNVMLYLPLGGEADVRSIYTKEKNFFIPITRGVFISLAKYTPETELLKGEYNILEPKNPIFEDKGILDLVIVPLVAADRSRNRMGFGKGCYDRFLENMDCTKIGAAFGFQIVESLSPKPYDIPMDYIITESECI